MVRNAAIMAATMVAMGACRSESGARVREVATEPTAFVPDQVEIAAGDTIRFAFGGLHDLVFDRVAGAPADLPPSPEGEYLRGFPQAGVFPYRCTLHPGMNGQVTVR